MKLFNTTFVLGLLFLLSSCWLSISQTFSTTSDGTTTMQIEKEHSFSSIGLNDPDVSVRENAVSRLTQHSALTHVAYHNTDNSIRILAKKRLNQVK